MLILHFQNHAILIGNATLFAIFSHILKIFIPLCYFTLDFSSRYIIILRIMNLHCQKNFQRILSVYIIIDTFAKNIWILITLLSTSGCYGSEGILHIALWRISVHCATMTTVIPHFPKCDKNIGSICFYVCKSFCWQSRRIFP